MPLIVDLDDLNYLHQVSNMPKKNLNETIDNIVDYLVKNCALLINDIEKNKKPVTLINDEILKYIKSNKISVVSQNNLNMLLTSINNYIWGYGPIQSFINDRDISDVYIFNKNCVAIKKYGKLQFTDIKFPTDKSLLNFCYNLAIKNGGSLSDINAKQILSDSKSQKDAILRIDIVIDPITYTGSQVEIRRLPKKKKSFNDLIKEGMLNAEIQKYLITAVKSGLNIVWTGRGGSGKTTLINACLDYVPKQDVQLIMQESEELFTSHKATFMQKVKKKQGESDVEYTLKDLTINALLMSLDRMVIGEIKDEEAMEFFNAVYSGHIGWTSVHSPSSEECMNKIVHLMKYSKTDLPREDLMEMLTEIDLIIYMEDYKCCELTEVAGWNEAKKKPLFNPVFKYTVKDKSDGSYRGEFIRIGDSCEKVMKKVKKAVVSGKLKGDGDIV
ncbi:Flp pilus assembly complex ATPase component TadA [Clostridium sp. WLY-B-L2]|uniref:Flp pilus assembly complex ATPase component TadA n=1 Tax=Clostridium aromativorans TaxID=2836848 RepID=A0ABS8N8A8_9CLOT|nr:ATPase, T2SS/T4P/T4SS family [Clostridium aromativorans]MCC9296023.1 Flp pilus assembly complex ATPase component TadA [Clostridium aromativorans]CAB1248998.1 Type II/IV secretion system ATP hydrolase TadA/VirB11/CpaF, TadA subfamily [Clostridiaceae bacterium BL-3]